MAKLSFIACALVATLLVVVRADGENEDLGIEILKAPDAGCRKAKDGDQLKIHYDGKLADGTPFDSSYDRNQPLPVALGKSQVIQGMERGLQGICLGEIRMLNIPPHLGYGDRGAGGVIPGGATLKFKVELMEFVNDEVTDSDAEL